MIEEWPPPAAPHTPSDDPRVDILADAIASYYRFADEHVREDTRRRARDLLARLDAAAPAPESPREERDRLYREHVQACTDPRHKHPALDTPSDTPQFDWQAPEEGFVPCARGQRCELQLVRPGKVQCDCETPGTDAAVARAEAEAAPARDDAPVPELWWSPEDGPIVRETRKGSAFYGEYRPANTVRWMTELPADAVRLVSARDDALARWLDTEIAEADRQAKRASTEYARALEARAYALSEVRDRLGATTNTQGS